MESEIVCPYCNTLITDANESPSDVPWDDDGELDIECSHCGKKMIIVCHYKDIEWELLDEDHDEIDIEESDC